MPEPDAPLFGSLTMLVRTRPDIHATRPPLRVTLPGGVVPGPGGRVRGADGRVRDCVHARMAPPPQSHAYADLGMRPRPTASTMRSWFPSVLRTVSTRFGPLPTGVGGRGTG